MIEVNEHGCLHIKFGCLNYVGGIYTTSITFGNFWLTIGRDDVWSDEFDEMFELVITYKNREIVTMYSYEPIFVNFHLRLFGKIICN
jgi:hypothetical protein